MSAAREPSMLRRWRETLRWGACFALALCFHAAGAAALLARWNEDSDLVANAPVIMIELAALPVAPEIKPTELPPGPQQTEAQPEPEPEKPVEKTVELPPEPQAEPQLAVTPPKSRSKSRSKKKPKQKHASLASAPSTAEHRAGARRRRCRAPPRAIPMRCRTGNRSWSPGSNATSAIPSEAQSRGEHGVAQLAFSVDRSGGVHNARIVRSSGSSLLDPRRWRWWSAPRRCRRRRRKLPARKSRSWCRSATISAD